MEQHILTMGNYRLACQLPQQAVRQLVYFHSPVDDLTPPGKGPLGEFPHRRCWATGW